MAETLGAAQARRISLAAQGFTGRARTASPAAATILAIVRRLRLLQIDSVNVWERSHYMPVYSRLGPYRKERLDGLSRSGPGRVGAPALTEYWPHEAAFLPVEDLPLFAFRKRRMREEYERRRPDFVRETAQLRSRLLREIAARGPAGAGELERGSRPAPAGSGSGSWRGGSQIARCLEFLFLAGELAAAPRVRFERRYGLPEQLLPPEACAAVPEEQAVRELVRRAAVAHGVGTAHDLADYFRLPIGPTRRAIAELCEDGELVPAEVAGWTVRDRPARAWLHREASAPRRVDRTALLSPFDPLVWHRDRALRLHGFHYRIEIYTPAARRRYGYYSLPVLIGERLSARTDLKNDRSAGVLRVRSAWSEPHAPGDAATRLAAELRRAAQWQGLSGITVEGRGDLAPALASELRVPLEPAG
ncbi:MAG: crosslink repair DNA glycosylase YcaQ family protein [Pseudoclavibacter sp.]|nr:crosslink repair DNA glycosylase YcaQ family protein [Pseudoclavibacter sp.]